MPDSAKSDHPRVQAQLYRLGPVSAAGDRLGLDRIRELLERLGRPQDRLPPIFHVAGTNGKGSTCAFLRAGLEAAGHTTHVFTSPHLVRFNERIRVAGSLISDETLAALLEQAIDAGEGLDASFFEVTTASAMLAFAGTHADACILEVGLGGRLDATNIVERPLVCGIASLGLDHQQFLGPSILSIAREKAAIAKAGVPLLLSRYSREVTDAVVEVAEAAGARPLRPSKHWHYEVTESALEYRDAGGALTLPLPAMEGAHQVDNCALALAMLRHQDRLAIGPDALRRMPVEARWPARLQRLGPGPLVEAAGGAAVWVDGGHNPDAAQRVSAWLGSRDRLPTVIVGLLANKDAAGVVGLIASTGARILAVPVPEHDCHEPAALAQIATRSGASSVVTADNLVDAVRLARGSDIAIVGSLYLAGEALASNGETPD